MTQSAGAIRGRGVAWERRRYRTWSEAHRAPEKAYAWERFGYTRCPRCGRQWDCWTLARRDRPSKPMNRPHWERLHNGG